MPNSETGKTAGINPTVKRETGENSPQTRYRKQCCTRSRECCPTVKRERTGIPGGTNSYPRVYQEGILHHPEVYPGVTHTHPEVYPGVTHTHPRVYPEVLSITHPRVYPEVLSITHPEVYPEGHY